MAKEEKLSVTTHRRRRLLNFAAQKLAAAKGGSVGFEDVEADVYPGLEKTRKKRRNQFFADCKQIALETRRMRFQLRLLGVPIPEATYRKGRLSLPVRGIPGAMTPSQRELRQNMAAALISAHVPSEPKLLLPRTDRLFAGFGTTVTEVIERIVDEEESFSNLLLHTPNLEIIMRLAGTAFVQPRHNRISLPGGWDVDWHEGCVRPAAEPPRFATSLIGFDSMDENGVFYSDAEDKCRMMRKALDDTQQTVLLIGESEKLGVARGRYPLHLPKRTNARRIFLCTDTDNNKDDYRLDPRVIPVYLLKGNQSAA